MHHRSRCCVRVGGVGLVRIVESADAVPHPGDAPICPVNGQIAKPVPRHTVERLVKPGVSTQLRPQPYYFCDAPECDVVYVSTLGDHLVTKDSLTVRVGIKETGDPAPLCYCFGYDRRVIREDIRNTGHSDIQRVITERVRAGECRCEETNPSGGCCLGDVSRAIKLAKRLREQGLL